MYNSIVFLYSPGYTIVIGQVTLITKSKIKIQNARKNFLRYYSKKLTSELNINTNECPKAWVQNVPIITFQVLVDVITIQTPTIRGKTTTMIDIVYPITN